MSNVKGSVELMKDCLAMTFLMEVPRIMQIMHGSTSGIFLSPEKLPSRSIAYCRRGMLCGWLLLTPFLYNVLFTDSGVYATRQYFHLTWSSEGRASLRNLTWYPLVAGVV